MLGWIKKKIQQHEVRSSISTAFSKVKDDLQEQRKWLEEHKKKFADLHENHTHFKKNTTVNHQRIGEWINHFDRSIKRLEKDILTLENKIYADMAGFVAESSKRFQDALASHRGELHTFKEELKRELAVFAAQNRLGEAENPVINVNNVDNVDNVMPEGEEMAYDGLSNPEKWLVGVLFNSEVPLSYVQISEKTGKSISTVRVYMNQLKIKGFVEESALPNGVKIFSLKHKAKVKKLYNL